MPKLRHKNILQLTAMMMGTPIEGYPRRRYVFHYYPKMTSEGKERRKVFDFFIFRRLW